MLRKKNSTIMSKHITMCGCLVLVMSLWQGSASAQNLTTGVTTNMDQLRNVVQGWTNGSLNASNSRYAEHESVPFRFFAIGVGPGETHTFTIQAEWTKGGVHAYDYFTTYDRTEADTIAIVGGGPCGNKSTNAPEDCQTPVEIATFPNPADPANWDFTSVGGSAPADFFPAGFAVLPDEKRKLMGYDVASVSFGKYYFTGTASTREINLGVTFTSAAVLNKTPTGDTIGLFWGGHLASSRTDNWGDGNGSGYISGASFHMRAISFDGGGKSNKDLGIQPSVINVCPDCSDISGPDTVCPGSQDTHTVNLMGVCEQPVYLWTLEGDGVLCSPTDGASVCVTAGSTCGGSYTLTLTVLCDRCSDPGVTCSKTVSIGDAEATQITCPPDDEVECDEVIDFGMATATDNCDSNPAITWVDVEIPGDCPQEKTIVRTWTATDACGGSSSCDQTITVVDTTPPVITCPTDNQVECSEAIDFGMATATDNCDSNPAITWVDVETPGDCPQEKTIQRTWTATDDCDNSASCVQTITVIDTTPPVITCPSDDQVECDEEIDFGTATATDNCDSTPAITSVDAETPGACPQQKTIVRTWTATDDCGNIASCDQTITVVDTTPPDMSECPESIAVCDGGAIAFDAPSAVDNCDSAVPVVCERSDGLPLTDPYPVSETVTITCSATDSCTNRSECSFDARVNPNPSCTIDDTSIAGLVRGTVSSGTAPLQCEARFRNEDTGWTANGDCKIEGSTFEVTYSVVQPASSPAEITVEITDAAGCTTQCSKLIISDPHCGIQDNLQEVCDGQDAEFCVNYSGGLPSYTYSWTGPDGFTADTACVKVGEHGDYAVVVTDGNGFTSPECTAHLDVNDIPTCDVDPDEMICLGEQLCATGSGAGEGAVYTIEWRDVATNVLHTCEGLAEGQPCCYTPDDIGSYTAVVISEDGCPSEGCVGMVTYCPTEEYCSLTQGFYGNAGGTFNGMTTIELIQSLLASQPLVIGKDGRQVTIPLESAQCIIDRLPGGGPSRELPSNLGNKVLSASTCQTNPKLPVFNNSGRFRNNLLSQVITLSLNVRLDPALPGAELLGTFCTQAALAGDDGLLGTDDDLLDLGPDGVPGCQLISFSDGTCTIVRDDPIGQYVVPASVLTAMTSLGLGNTVGGLLELANLALAGESTADADLNQINQAVGAINDGFDECRWIVPCPNDCPAAPDPCPEP